MNCGCEGTDKKKKFSILKGKENLLHLIRGIAKDDQDEPPSEGEVIKTETLPEEVPTQTDTFEQDTEVDQIDKLENDIQVKRLEHILDTIERLRYNADNPQKFET